MKIKNNRIIKCVTCLATCFMLVVAVMTTPANALSYLNPDDYLYEVVADGNNKIARYDFSDLYCFIHTWDDASNNHADARWEVEYPVPDAAHSVLFDIFPLGGYQEPTVLDWRSVALDIHDILPGSPLPFSCDFNFHYEYGTVGAGSATLYYSVGVYYFDADGSWIGTADGETHTEEIHADPLGVFDKVYHVSSSFPAKAYFVVPFITLRTVFNSTHHTRVLSVREQQFRLDISIDTVIENSNMMQSINNKLDDIISGGEAGDALGDATDNMDKDNNALGGVLDDYHDSIEKLPSTPDNFDHVVDDEALGDAIEEANKIFNWDISGLNYMFVPMSISLSLAVLFYVVFGKKG